MKILWIDPDNQKFAVGILDNDNFVHAKLTKSKGWESFQFFSSLPSAIARVCHQKSNERCTDLSDWLTHYGETMEHFQALFDHIEPQNTTGKARRRAGKATASKETSCSPPATAIRTERVKSGDAA